MKSYLHEVRYGLIVALALLVWLTLEYAAGLHSTRIEYHPSVTNFYGLIPIYMIWRAIIHRRDVIEGGSIHWWQGLISGMMISLVTAAFGAPTIWLFTNFINPQFFQSMIDFAVKSGMKSEMAEVNFHPTVYMMQATIMPLVFGFPTSVLITWLARRKNKNKAPVEANAS